MQKNGKYYLFSGAVSVQESKIRVKGKQIRLTEGQRKAQETSSCAGGFLLLKPLFDEARQR
jgi:hypothetical protein